MTNQNTFRMRIADLIKEISKVQQVYVMYSRDHDISRKSINKLYYMLEELLFEENTITIGVIGKEIAYKEEPFYDLTEQLSRLISHLKEIGLEKFSFVKGMTREELEDFISIVSLNAETINNTGGIDQRLKAAGVNNISSGKLGSGQGDSEELSLDEITIAKQAIDSGESLFKTIEDSYKDNQAINLENVKSFVGSIINNLITNRNSLLILTAVKSHDEYSFVHNINVAIFSILQAESLGLDQTIINEIGIAALLHDVGKLNIPGEILRKNEALTDDEMKVMLKHAITGAKMILDSPDINPLAAKVAFEHHVKYDRSGYPERYFEDECDLATMIVTIADAYDALRSRRVYAGEVAPEETYNIMNESAGIHFQEDLLKNFFRIVGIYPPGTLVELDTGHVGLVISESHLDPGRPQVEVLYDDTGNKQKKPYVINLMEKCPDGETFKYSIQRSLIPDNKINIPEEYRDNEK